MCSRRRWYLPPWACVSWERNWNAVCPKRNWNAGCASNIRGGLCIGCSLYWEGCAISLRFGILKTHKISSPLLPPQWLDQSWLFTQLLQLQWFCLVVDISNEWLLGSKNSILSLRPAGSTQMHWPPTEELNKWIWDSSLVRVWRVISREINCEPILEEP